jgi:hypothetical protein
VIDQMGVFIGEAELERPETNLDALRGLAGALPFEPAMFHVALLNVRNETALEEPGRQWPLAKSFFNGQDDLLASYERVLKVAPDRTIFSPQALALLMRVLIDEAPDQPFRDIAPDEFAVLQAAVLGAHSAIETSLDALSLPDRDALLAYELQAATFFRRSAPLEEMSRHAELLRLASVDDRLVGSKSRVDVLDWLAKAGGMSADDQFAIGFGLSATTRAFDDPIRPRALAEHVDDLLLKLGMDDVARALPVLSSTRDEFRARFAALGGEPAAYAWELRPFKSTPFLRLANGDLMLLGSSWLLSWLGEGFHYRAMTHAQEAEDEKTLLRYTAYQGEIVETYALDLAETAVEAPTFAIGEQAYDKGQQRTSDVAVLEGPDLVLFEIHARRVGASAAVTGSAVEATTEVSKLLVTKADQLGRCIGHLLDESAQLPGVDIGAVKRIWPVVVSVGYLLQSPNLWEFLRSSLDPEKSKAFEDPRVQPLQLLTIADYEKLMGLVSIGESLSTMLQRKTSGAFRDRDLSAWLHGDPRAPSDEPRHPALETRWQEMGDRVIAIADMTVGIQADQPAE